ncbi:hypothetical protein [Paenibacillus sp. YN15]|uniref:hypothetical protein n=1 Tax=Paenibacillus sp. YN15 TaxID=1742774 RepID=UPI0015EC6BC1|nr:hypothetical protein [Paenibacillus sp. YN15]
MKEMNDAWKANRSDPPVGLGEKRLHNRTVPLRYAADCIVRRFDFRFEPVNP